jgi:uncharacterized membrane protein
MATKRIILSCVLLIIFDSIYIYINQKTFQNTVIDIQRVVLTVKPVGVIVTYLFLMFALNYFIISRFKGPEEAFLLGLVIYGVFEGTCYAIFKKWSLNLAIMDTLWGGILFALSTYFTYFLTGLSHL